MANVHTINDFPEADGMNVQFQGQGVNGAQNMNYNNPMAACCARIPIVTIVMAAVEFLLWFIFIFIDDSEWVPQTCTWPREIESGEVWRFITPAIMHEGYWQIFFDLIFLFLMGIQIELRVGSLCFIWLSVLFTILTYFLNWVLSGIPYWAGGFADFYDLCTFGIFPLLMCFIMLDLRLTGSKWTSFFMLFPIPSAVLPFIYIGLCLLFSWSYLPVMLLVSAVLVGFISWTGVLRFIVPRGECFRSCERKMCPKLARWPHWANASVSDNVRHFPIKMGQGPEPFTCCCNRWRPPTNGNIADAGNPYYGYQVMNMNPSVSDSDNAHNQKKKKDNKKKKNFSVDTSTSSLDSWGDNKGKGRTIGNSSQQYNQSTSPHNNNNNNNNNNGGGGNKKSNNKKSNDGFTGKARHL